MESIIPLPLTPPLGHPVPNVRHAVSVQLPTWDDIKEMFTGAPRVKSVQQAGYPRSFIHQDVKKLHQICRERFAPPSDSCFLFPRFEYAEECRQFITSKSYNKDDALAPHLVSIRSIELELDGIGINEEHRVITLHAIFCPSDKTLPVSTFWRLAGVGISSRLAEFCCNHLSVLLDITGITNRPINHLVQSRWTDPSHRKLCQRISSLLKRAPSSKEQYDCVARDDVYLYQSGMSAIYHAQQLLLEWRGAQSIVFGFPYELTLKLLEIYGPSTKFYPFGTEEELDLLQEYLDAEFSQGRSVQAIWCECPSNPLLKTADLRRIRGLADKYNFALVVDETIGGFANVDVLGVADIIVTSLTKSFNGFADVMGGSIVLSPASSLYSTFKEILDRTYVNTVFSGDTEQLERNSRDFLLRTERINSTASYLVRSLQPLIEDPSSALTQIYYPEIDLTVKNYRALMRRPTEEFTPGFGGLFTLQFEDVHLASVFFNALNVHKGPSLGAHITLSQPYVQTVFHKQKEWAAECGLHPSIVRVSVGLEDKEGLLAAFRLALAEADHVRETRKSDNQLQEEKGFVQDIEDGMMS